MVLIAGCLKRLREGQHSKGLVVEHLLEVGNEPLPVRAVAVETVAELIEDPAPAHRRRVFSAIRIASASPVRSP